MSSRKKLRPRGFGAWPVDKRFWHKVDTSEDCWEWRACMWPNGYGLFYFDGKAMSAHRVSWILTNGPIESNKIFVCHKCDNRKCVRPDHLFLGDNSDNMRDAYSKGRGRGLNPHHGKLSDDERRNAVQLVKQGESRAAVGRRYGVSGQAITHLVKSGLYE